MNLKLIFYTEKQRGAGFVIRYISPDTGYQLETFAPESGVFDDPGEASQEFQAWSGTAEPPCYLNNAHFARKLAALRKMQREQVQAVQA